MDLIPGQRSPCKGRGGGGRYLGAAFFEGKNRPGGQQLQPAQGLRAAAFGPGGIIQHAAQHLVAAAYAQNRRAAPGQLLHGGFQPALAQPQQIIHGIFGAGQNDEVGHAQFPRGLHIAHAQQGVLLQRHKIGKVGDVRQPHNGNIQRFYGIFLLQTLREGIFVLDIHFQVRHHTHDGQAGLFFQHRKAGAQNFYITTEFVDNQAADPRALTRFQQLHRAVQLGKHTAAVDISGQQHRRVDQPGKAHVDDVVGL